MTKCFKTDSCAPVYKGHPFFKFNFSLVSADVLACNSLKSCSRLCCLTESQAAGNDQQMAHNITLGKSKIMNHSLQAHTHSTDPLSEIPINGLVICPVYPCVFLPVQHIISLSKHKRCSSQFFSYSSRASCKHFSHFAPKTNLPVPRY